MTKGKIFSHRKKESLEKGYLKVEREKRLGSERWNDGEWKAEV